ncbi:type II toxin-antitoxin system Phd/YefM family antitoxin [Dehalococcoidia bacterium]|nr:type II toxin-antitoxin system Phd/YefM family antitoxin [Dehalococcoidia bacterium]
MLLTIPHVASFLKQVHETKRPVIITQRGKGAAVLLDVAEYEAIQEKIELLEDIQCAISQIEDGLGVSHRDAKNEIMGCIRK